MAVNHNDAVIVRSTIELGHNLGLKVIAEGVETQVCWDRLKTLGCDSAQGYHMSHPLPADEFMEWLGQSKWGTKT
jgi:EAL domain-containing protein (putative c-di-GMP-specific phosphodiesterase class I)